MFAVGIALVLGVPHSWRSPIDAAMWFVVPVAVRSASNPSLSLYRSAGHYGRYNAMVLIENVVGFGSHRLGRHDSAPEFARPVPAACVVVYGPWVLSAYRWADKFSMKRAALTYEFHGLASILSQSSTYTDRFVTPVRRWSSACDLRRGMVAVIQPIILIGVAISTATLPLAFQELERHGVEAGARGRPMGC
jgi:hypothetical protein